MKSEWPPFLGPDLIQEEIKQLQGEGMGITENFGILSSFLRYGF